jgi:hypothetical protein
MEEGIICRFLGALTWSLRDLEENMTEREIGWRKRTYLATAREDATDPVSVEVAADRNLWTGRSPVERCTATTMARAPHRERRKCRTMRGARWARAWSLTVGPHRSEPPRVLREIRVREGRRERERERRRGGEAEATEAQGGATDWRC